MTKECRKCGHPYHKQHGCSPVARYIAGHYDAKKNIKKKIKLLEHEFDKWVPFAEVYDIITKEKP